MPIERYGTPRRKGLRKKIVSSILVIGILPLMLGVFLTYQSERKILTNSIGANFEAIAKETAGKIEISLKNELMEARNLTLLPDLIEAVTRSNLLYKETGEEGIQKGIHRMTPPSRSSSSHNSLYRQILYNDVSLYLKKLVHYEDEYRAIIVTDEKGMLVAASEKGFDIDQSKNRWWQIAYHHGKGKIFVSNIYLDNKSGDHLMEIAAPVYPPGETTKGVIGIIKIIYKADTIFKIIEGVKIGITGHANLVSSDGTIIICPIFPPQSHSIKPELLRVIATGKKGWGITEDDGHGGTKSIIGFAPVRITGFNGDSFIEKDWYIFVRQNPQETYTPISNLLLKISISGFLLIGAFALTGYYAANKIVTPILLLKEEAELIGIGNLEHRVHVNTNDEIESLAEEFNRMAERLQESLKEAKRERDNLEHILLGAGEGIVVADAQNKVIMINPVAEKILGIDGKEVIGKSIFPCHRNPDRVAQVLEQGATPSLSMTTSIGERIVEINVAVIRSEEGPIGSMMIMKDVTPIKQMENDLKRYSEQLEKMVEERTREISETKKYLENLLENANDVIFTIDREGIFTYLSQKLEDWGYKKEEVIGKPIYFLFEEGLGEDEIAENITKGIKKIYEGKVKTKGGEIRNTVISTSPLKDADGSIIGLLGIARDITERKRLQEQMSRAEKLAAIGQLSMGIAHEINNPLSGMLNCVRALAAEPEDEKLKKKYLLLIEKGLSRIEYIVRQLLGFAKEYQFEYTVHSLDGLISETLDLLRYKIEKGNIRLQVDLNCGQKKYLLPGNHIQQVILNIVMNAIQAMPDGGTLSIESYEEKNNLVFIVSDTGIGIPQENLSRIFDPFFTTKDVGTGTGLGLSLSYGIIEKMGGNIEVTSEVGKGSSFKVTLPRREGKELREDPR